MREKRILILGAKGNLGTQLVKTLEKDHDVVAWDIAEIDIRDNDLVKRKINSIKFDVIINATAYNAVDKCEAGEEFEKAKLLNGIVPGNLADIALDNNVLLIHFSSDYVFAGDKKEGYNETDQPSPINKYGETKLLGEREIISRSGKGLKYYIIRTSKLFGPKGDSEICKPSFFDIIVDVARNKNEVQAVDDELSCFTYTPDLAKAIKKIIEKYADKNKRKGYGIYHLINEGPATWHDGARSLFEITQTSIKLIPIHGDQMPRAAKRPANSILLNTKLPKMRSYKEALREYFKV